MKVANKKEVKKIIDAFHPNAWNVFKNIEHLSNEIEVFNWDTKIKSLNTIIPLSQEIKNKIKLAFEHKSELDLFLTNPDTRANVKISAHDDDDAYRAFAEVCWGSHVYSYALINPNEVSLMEE